MRAQLEQKRGVLGAGQVKRGVFTEVHTYTGHICDCQEDVICCTFIQIHILYIMNKNINAEPNYL